MNVYPEVKKICSLNLKMAELIKKLSDKIDLGGVRWETAEFVKLNKQDIEYMKERYYETNDYFTEQHVGYQEDDFYGYLYFKTDVPGQYVRVYFAI